MLQPQVFDLPVDSAEQACFTPLSPDAQSIEDRQQIGSNLTQQPVSQKVHVLNLLLHD